MVAATFNQCHPPIDEAVSLIAGLVQMQNKTRSRCLQTRLYARHTLCPRHEVLATIQMPRPPPAPRSALSTMQGGLRLLNSPRRTCRPTLRSAAHPARCSRPCSGPCRFLSSKAGSRSPECSPWCDRLHRETRPRDTRFLSALHACHGLNPPRTSPRAKGRRPSPG